ncbi:MAG: DUF4344 domain-containing metallopeptidase [Alphaproteobacteria bacterium]
MRVPRLALGLCAVAILAFSAGPASAASAPNPFKPDAGTPNPLSLQTQLKLGKRLGPEPGSSADQCRARGGQPILLPGARPEDSICMGPDFVPDNLLFISLHELGHGLVHAYNIPTFAEDEDVSDKFATFILVAQQDPSRFARLVNSAVFWLTAEKLSQGTSNRAKFWDEHSLEGKRGTEVLCHIVGAIRLIQQQNPNDNEWIRPYRQLGLYPENDSDQRTLFSCRRRAAKNLIDWTSILLESSALAPPIKEDWHVYSLITVPDVIYEPTGNPQLQTMANRLQAMRSLEILRGFVVDSQLLASKQLRSIRMIGRACGYANAFFNPSTSEMTICYEMVGLLDQIEAEIRSQSVRIGFDGKPIAPKARPAIQGQDRVPRIEN